MQTEQTKTTTEKSLSNIEAPDFSLKDQNGDDLKLSDYSEQYVLLYFYPKDDTPGCTTEACTIRDIYDGFAKRNIKVIGVSPDSPKSHQKFIEKYHLPFTLVSDDKHEVAKLYHADGIFFKRISYLIGPGLKVIKEYPKVSPSTHAQQILDDFDNLTK